MIECIVEEIMSYLKANYPNTKVCRYFSKPIRSKRKRRAKITHLSNTQQRSSNNNNNKPSPTKSDTKYCYLIPMTLKNPIVSCVLGK